MSGVQTHNSLGKGLFSKTDVSQTGCTGQTSLLARGAVLIEPVHVIDIVEDPWIQSFTLIEETDFNPFILRYP